MSVRVNLLPREAHERRAAARQRGMIGLAGLALLLVLGLVYWLQLERVSDARDERDAAQAELDELAAREEQLSDYRNLQERVADAEGTITAALAHEISFAGILQDIAVVTPPDAAFTDLEATVIETPEGEQARDVVARIIVDGESVDGHAPGLERLLIQLDKIAGFFDVYFTDSTTDPEIGVTQFSVEVDVGTEALTGRYFDGVPEELR